MSRFLANPTVFPTKIPNLQFWLDAQDTGTFTWNNGFLSQWNDKSGLNYHCTQSTPSNQPSYTGSNIAFGGTSNAFMNIPQAAINNAPTYSMFWVMNPISQSNWFMVKQHNGNNTHNALSMTRFVVSGGSPGDGTSQFMYWHPQNSVDITNSSNAISTNTLQLFALHYNGTTLTMTRNGTTLSATASANSAIANQTGATNFLLGAWISDIAGNSFNNPGVTNFQLSELLFYNGTLTTTQIQQLEGYLTWKWSLQASLSNGHPFGARNPGRLPLSQTPSLTQFRPTNLSNCLLWMDAADSATFSLTSSNTVAAWYDKSGNANTVLQSTGSQQPLWQSNVQVGLPGVLFAGGSTNQRLVTASTVAAINGIPGITLFAVLRPTWTSGQGGINNPSFFGMRQFANTNTKINYYFLNNYSGTAMFNGTSVVNHTGSNATGSIGQNRNLLYCSTNNNGTDLAYYNGSLTADSQGISFGASTSLPIIVGGDNINTEDWVGYLFEIIFYPYVLTNSDRQLVEGYLATKWGLTLPVNHSLQGRTSYSLTRSLNPVDAFKRFSVNFDPNSIPGCQLWLDATDTTTMAFTSSTAIAQWRDKSANRFVGVSVGSPTLTPNAQGLLSGISFDGSTQYFNFGDVNDFGTNQFFAFIVCKFNTTGNGSVFAKSAAADATGRYALLRESGILIPLIQGSTTGVGSANNSGVADTNTSVRLLTMVWDRSTITLYQNGTSVFSTAFENAANLTTTYPLLIGAYNNGTGGIPPLAGLYFNGIIMEMIHYFAPLTTAQRQTVESYLAQKWGLTSALPTNHANFTSPAGLPPTLTLSRKPFGFRVRLGPVTISSLTASGVAVTVTWQRQSSASYQLTLFSNSTNSTTGGLQVTQITTQGLTNTFSSLLTNTFYYVVIRSIDIDGITLGPSTPTSSAVGTTPAAPASSTLSFSSGTANCSWTASTTASTYTVQLYALGVLSQTNTGVTGTSTTFTGFTGNTNHYIIVTAVNSAGSSSGTQSSTVLAVPSALGSSPSLSYSGTTANASWSAPTGGATSYTIQLYANGVLSQTNSGVTGTTTSFSSLAGNTNHYVAVTAVNASGGSAATNSATVLSLPGTPTSPTLSITTPAPGTATVSWAAPTGGAASYTIQFFQNGGLRTTNTGITGTSTTFTTVTGNATYYAIVVAVNATGNSSGAQTANNEYLILPDAVTAGGIFRYPYSSTTTPGISVFNTPANRATAYFVRIFSSNVNFSTGGNIAANLTGSQWSGGGAAWGPAVANTWYYAQIWSSNAAGSNGPFQTPTIQATAITFTSRYSITNSNAYMNFVFGTSQACIIQCWGASGNAYHFGTGSRGAFVRGTLSIAANTHYRATVGVGGGRADVNGKTPVPVYNGAGGQGSFPLYGSATLNGGGRSAWQAWNGSAWVDHAIAGGGGGDNGEGNNSSARHAGGFAAGSGTGFQGGNAAQTTATAVVNEGISGGGGSTTQGGLGGAAAQNGGLGFGGPAGSVNSAGGGGGFYGGAGGIGTPNAGGAGGGGSSFLSGSMTSTATFNGNSTSLTTQGGWAGNAAISGNDGLVTIDF